ncbi:MAG TPA: hypothetical protein VF815_42145 [Myxococcaceae bacterium]|jgi:hypothetical protein
MTATSKPASLWISRPRPRTKQLKATSSLQVVFDREPQDSPESLTSLAAQPSARVAEFLAPQRIGGGQGFDVAVLEQASGRTVAFATVLRAQGSEFQHRTRLPASALESAAWLTRVHVAPDAPAGTSSVLLYSALRQARGWGSTTAAFLMADDQTPTAMRYGISPLTAVPRLDVPGTGAFRAKAQRLDLLLHKSAEEAAAAGQTLEPSFLVTEIRETIETLFLDRMQQTRFFQTVEAGTLTREQYVYMLTQLHQFVRYTTRLLGRCVALSEESQMRNHFIHHLTGEINHEVIIEKDLEYLGEDAQYVKHAAQPNLATRQFMATQESAIGFYSDPVLMLAAPLAAEGVSGHLDGRVLEKIHALMASWGVKEPKKATHFISSHIEFDGGDDGHWQGNLAMLAHYLRNEAQLRRFLALLRVSVDAVLRQYDSYVGDVELWSARPE